MKKFFTTPNMRNLQLGILIFLGLVASPIAMDVRAPSNLKEFLLDHEHFLEAITNLESVQYNQTYLKNLNKRKGTALKSDKSGDSLKTRAAEFKTASILLMELNGSLKEKNDELRILNKDRLTAGRKLIAQKNAAEENAKMMTSKTQVLKGKARRFRDTMEAKVRSAVERANTAHERTLVLQHDMRVLQQEIETLTKSNKQFKKQKEDAEKKLEATIKSNDVKIERLRKNHDKFDSILTQKHKIMFRANKKLRADLQTLEELEQSNKHLKEKISKIKTGHAQGMKNAKRVRTKKHKEENSKRKEDFKNLAVSKINTVSKLNEEIEKLREHIRILSQNQKNGGGFFSKFFGKKKK